MPGTATKKLTVTIITANGTTVTKTYDVVTWGGETTDEKTFTGRRNGETTDGVIVVNKKMILDEKLEDV